MLCFVLNIFKDNLICLKKIPSKMSATFEILNTSKRKSIILDEVGLRIPPRKLKTSKHLLFTFENSSNANIIMTEHLGNSLVDWNEE